MIDNAYTIKETCEKLHVSRPTLYRWEAQGLIKFTRISKKTVRVKESEINKLLDGGEDATSL